MRTALLCLLIACGGKPAPAPAPEVKPAVPTAKPSAPVEDTQESARTSARDVDLPLLRTADRAVLTWRSGETGERRGADLAALVAALAITDARPSGGVNHVVIAFYRGDNLLREIWVFGDGEWGIQRTGATSWTLGLSDQLAMLVKR
jgi:hypothetical protein